MPLALTRIVTAIEAASGFAYPRQSAFHAPAAPRSSAQVVTERSLFVAGVGRLIADVVAATVERVIRQPPPAPPLDSRLPASARAIPSAPFVVQLMGQETAVALGTESRRPQRGQSADVTPAPNADPAVNALIPLSGPRPEAQTAALSAYAERIEAVKIVVGMPFRVVAMDEGELVFAGRTVDLVV